MVCLQSAKLINTKPVIQYMGYNLLGFLDILLVLTKPIINLLRVLA